MINCEATLLEYSSYRFGKRLLKKFKNRWIIWRLIKNQINIRRKRARTSPEETKGKNRLCPFYKKQKRKSPELM